MTRAAPARRPGHRGKSRVDQPGVGRGLGAGQDGRDGDAGGRSVRVATGGTTVGTGS